jgi:hypothetical protein
MTFKIRNKLDAPAIVMIIQLSKIFSELGTGDECL